MNWKPASGQQNMAGLFLSIVLRIQREYEIYEACVKISIVDTLSESQPVSVNLTKWPEQYFFDSNLRPQRREICLL